jgi:hypothetical protein
VGNDSYTDPTQDLFSTTPDKYFISDVLVMLEFDATAEGKLVYPKTNFTEPSTNLTLSDYE